MELENQSFVLSSVMTTVFIVARVDGILSAACHEREIGEILSRERDRRDLLFF